VKTIPVPPGQVFAAWGDPAGMFDWYAPTDEYTTPVAEIDFRVGGTYRVGMKHTPSGHLNLLSGQYCRIEPPGVLSFTWAREAPNAVVHETQVTVEFRPHPGGTDLTLTHERFRDEEQRRKHAEGWAGCLNRLARKLSP